MPEQLERSEKKEKLVSLFKIRLRAFIRIFNKYWLKPIILGIVVIGIHIVTTKFTFKGDLVFLNEAFAIAIITSFTWFLILVITGIKDAVIRNILEKAENILIAQRVHTQASILVKIITIVILVVSFALILMVFPQIRKVGVSILASAGIAGVIVGFAAQKSLGNLFSGIQVAFSQPVKIGDVVSIEGDQGIVEQVGLTHVIMCAYDRRRIVVPINYFLEKKFENWTVDSSDLIGRILLELDYKTPIQKIREVLDSILEGTKLWDGMVKTVEVIDAKPQTMQIRISVSALNSSNTWDLKCYVREKMIEFLQQNYPDCLPRFRLEMEEHKM